MPLDVVFSGHGTQAACRKKSQSVELLFDPIASYDQVDTVANVVILFVKLQMLLFCQFAKVIIL